MPTTFNQIPPLSQGSIFFDVEDGDLMFAEDSTFFPYSLEVYREDSMLVMKCHDLEMRKKFPDHDDTVDLYLHAFYELNDEVLCRLQMK